MKIGILSDTHGYLDNKVFEYFKNCQQVWHAGDIGTTTVTDILKNRFELKAVYGNIDGTELRKEFKEILCFEVEGKRILLTHIAGSFAKYNKNTADIIQSYKPDVLVCGHSHILKVAFDHKYNLLYINPGAAGTHGFHRVKTLIRFEIQNAQIKNMEVIELGKRA